MRLTATIFVEGEADVKFLSDFVKRKFDYSLKKGEEIQQTKGKDSLTFFQKNFQQSSGRGFTNLVIFDANGSFQDRLNELNLKMQELDIQSETFLLPNNNNSGNLETVLEEIINPGNKFIFDCFDNFNKCIVKVEKKLYPLNQKTKIYTYVSVLVEDVDLAKERFRNYLNTEHWDLNSKYLKPLFDFLQPHFVKD